MICDLSGSVALVTGGRGAIGAAIAQYLAAAGAVVATSDLPGVAPTQGGSLQLDHDVTSPEQWRSAVDTVLHELGPVDILCNAAGIRPPITNVDELTLDMWTTAFQVNATGTLFGCQAVLPGMKQRGTGKIVNVSSTLGKESLAGSAAYGASKHAVLALTQSLAHEVGQFNINVNAVCPGPVNTPLLNPSGDVAAGAELEARLSALAPMKRIATPDDVAALVTFLASEQARNIQGQSINVDAGRSMHV